MTITRRNAVRPIRSRQSARSVPIPVEVARTTCSRIPIVSSNKPGKDTRVFGSNRRLKMRRASRPRDHRGSRSTRASDSADFPTQSPQIVARQTASASLGCLWCQYIVEMRVRDLRSGEHDADPSRADPASCPPCVLLVCRASVRVDERASFEVRQVCLRTLYTAPLPRWLGSRSGRMMGTSVRGSVVAWSFLDGCVRRGTVLSDAHPYQFRQ